MSPAVAAAIKQLSVLGCCHAEECAKSVSVADKEGAALRTLAAAAQMS